MQPLTKRQREILDYLNEFIAQHGYAPSLEEIGERFSLSSLATVHKHLTNLQEKGFIRRSWNRSRSVELLPSRSGGRAIDLPMLGFVAAGMPIEDMSIIALSQLPSQSGLPVTVSNARSNPVPLLFAVIAAGLFATYRLLRSTIVRLPPRRMPESETRPLRAGVLLMT